MPDNTENETLTKITTGIDGVDFMLMGGLPKNRTTLVTGTAGSGKTILATQILATGVATGEGGAVFVTFEEEPEQLRQSMRGFDFPIDEWEAADRWAFIDTTGEQTDTIEVGSFDLDGLYARIESAVKRTGATRVCLDSLGAIYNRFRRAEVIRLELHRLALKLRRLGVTPLITAERHYGSTSVTPDGFEEFVADTVIVLRNELDMQRRQRTLEILKLRGSNHRTGEAPMTITKNKGVSVIAMPVVELDQASEETRISTGVAELDDMCGGGFLRDSIVLVSGSTGTGKTLMSTSFIQGGAQNGERCLLLGYEESRAQIIRNAAGWGIPFRDYEDQGLLRIECSYPERIGLEEHLLLIEELIEEYKPQRIAIDSLSALERSGPAHSFRNFVLTLTAILKQRQIAAVITSTGSTSLNTTETIQGHFSTITDTIVLLRYVEIGGAVSRAVTVLKMRGSAHDKEIREFTVTDRGMRIGDPFRDLYGIITGEVRALPGIDQTRIKQMFSH